MRRGAYGRLGRGPRLFPRRTDLARLEVERGDGALVGSDERARVALASRERRASHPPEELLVPVEGAHLVGVGCKLQDVGFRYLGTKVLG